MRREAPEPWAKAMREAGAVDPRNDRPSMSALAKAANLHTTTVASLIFRDRDTEPEVVERVAEALGVDVRTVSEWAGINRPVREPYIPPAEANMLTGRQRKALTELIRSFTQSVGVVEELPRRRLEVVREERVAADTGERHGPIGPEDEPTNDA